MIEIIISALIGIVLGLIFMVGVAFGSYIGTILVFKRTKWIIRLDEAKEQMELQPTIVSEKEASYLPEATEPELREMETEPRWRRFLKKFVKLKL